jgi:hypothetical protein
LRSKDEGREDERMEAKDDRDDWFTHLSGKMVILSSSAPIVSITLMPSPVSEAEPVFATTSSSPSPSILVDTEESRGAPSLCMRADRPAGFRAYSKKVLRNSSTPKLVMADPKNKRVWEPVCTGKREREREREREKERGQQISEERGR